MRMRMEASGGSPRLSLLERELAILPTVVPRAILNILILSFLGVWEVCTSPPHARLA